MGVIKAFNKLLAHASEPLLLRLDKNNHLYLNYNIVSTLSYKQYGKNYLPSENNQNIPLGERLKKNHHFHSGFTYLNNYNGEPIIAQSNRARKESTPLRYSSVNLILRDMDRCQYLDIRLNNSNRTLDHIVPRYLGGTTRWNNVILSERKTNGQKGHQRLKDFFENAKSMGLKLRGTLSSITEQAREPTVEALFQNYCLLFPWSCHPEWIDQINWGDFKPRSDLKQIITTARQNKLYTDRSLRI